MQGTESVQDLHRVILAYFTAADCDRVDIVYDYACGLFEFFANRNPEFLRTLRVHVDSMHYEGHTCNGSFCARTSKAVASSNTSAGESVNSSYAKQKNNVRYMKSYNVVRHIQSLMVISNMKALTKTSKVYAGLPSLPEGWTLQFP